MKTIIKLTINLFGLVTFEMHIHTTLFDKKVGRKK